MSRVLLALLLGYLAGDSSGSGATHRTVARECERLGAFYVGEKIYECQLKVDATPATTRPGEGSVLLQPAAPAPSAPSAPSTPSTHSSPPAKKAAP